jgi:hypothetical protein
MQLWVLEFDALGRGFHCSIVQRPRQLGQVGRLLEPLLRVLV